MKAQRLDCSPIITVGSSPTLEGNVNGPSLVLAPPWLENPLGKYYLYFAHHNGTFIRLAYSDHLEGPWRIYEPGTLRLEDSFCYDHIASPDVHVDAENQQVRMYYHGWAANAQRTKVAVSDDGINFAARPENLGHSYFRVFQWGDYHYALGMPGIFYRSKDGMTGFELGPTVFPSNIRHTALDLVGDTLNIYYSYAFSCPESILHCTIDLTQDWMDWKASEPALVLEPSTDYEGIDAPLAPSKRGAILDRVRQLRDPGIFRENGQTYLLYSVAGEQGIALAELQK